MSVNLQENSIDNLLLLIQSEDADSDSRYVATQEVLKRWRKGADLVPLKSLLRSEKTRDRLQGAYYLNELGEAVEGLKVAATQLADNSLSHCRQAFVQYMASAGYFDEMISSGLAKCLLDLDLYVRLTTIKWAARTSDERFEHFSRLVEAGVGRIEPGFPNARSNDFWNESSRTRADRGLNIIRRIRAGEEIQQIRKDIPEEDSVVFDSFLFTSTRRERLAEWRHEKFRR